MEINHDVVMDDRMSLRLSLSSTIIKPKTTNVQEDLDHIHTAYNIFYTTPNKISHPQSQNNGNRKLRRPRTKSPRPHRPRTAFRPRKNRQAEPASRFQKSRSIPPRLGGEKHMALHQNKATRVEARTGRQRRRGELEEEACGDRSV